MSFIHLTRFLPSMGEWMSVFPHPWQIRKLSHLRRTVCCLSACECQCVGIHLSGSKGSVPAVVS